MNNLYYRFDSWLTKVCLDIYGKYTSAMAEFQAELYKQLDSRTKND